MFNMGSGLGMVKILSLFFLFCSVQFFFLTHCFYKIQTNLLEVAVMGNVINDTVV